MKGILEKLTLLTLAFILCTISSCAAPVTAIKSWPRIIANAGDTTATIRVMIPEKKRTEDLCFPIFEVCEAEKDKEPEYETAAIGTGFVIKPNGLLATNFHVVFPQIVKKDTKIWVEFKNGKKFLVQETFSFPLYDIVLLQIDAEGLSTVHLEQRRSLKLGDPVVAAGWKPKSTLTFSEGMVASMFTKPSGVFLQYRWVETTILIYPGFSGGPVFNKYGNVVGISNAVFSSRPGFSLIIPVKSLMEVLRKDRESDTKEKLEMIAEVYDKLDP